MGRLNLIDPICRPVDDFVDAVTLTRQIFLKIFSHGPTTQRVQRKRFSLDSLGRAVIVEISRNLFRPSSDSSEASENRWGLAPHNSSRVYEKRAKIWGQKERNQTSNHAGSQELYKVMFILYLYFFLVFPMFYFVLTSWLLCCSGGFIVCVWARVYCF